MQDYKIAQETIVYYCSSIIKKQIKHGTYLLCINLKKIDDKMNFELDTGTQPSSPVFVNIAWKKFNMEKEAIHHAKLRCLAAKKLRISGTGVENEC